MNFAYMRVSTKDKQEFIRQEFVLKDYKIDKVFEEKISGTKKACGRQEFEKMLKELKAGDTVYFESMSRMARSVQFFLPVDRVHVLALTRLRACSISERQRNSTSLSSLSQTS